MVFEATTFIRVSEGKEYDGYEKVAVLEHESRPVLGLDSLRSRATEKPEKSGLSHSHSSLNQYFLVAVVADQHESGIGNKFEADGYAI